MWSGLKRLAVNACDIGMWLDRPRPEIQREAQKELFMNLVAFRTIASYDNLRCFVKVGIEEVS